MGLAAEIHGRVRSTQDCHDDLAGGDSAPLVINPLGMLSYAEGSPNDCDSARLRGQYYVMQQTAVAPVVAIPTTTAQMTLWNGEQDGGKTYFLEKIGTFCAVSAGAATGIGILGSQGIGRKAAVVSDLTPKGTAGQRYRGAGLVDLAATVTSELSWISYGTSTIGPASQIGCCMVSHLDGLIAIPPGHYFSIAAVANTVTTITCRSFIRWHEIQVSCAP